MLVDRYQLDKNFGERVYWILAAIMVLITLTVPRLRPVGVAGCVILSVMLAWAMLERWRGQDLEGMQRGRPASPAAASIVLAPESVTVQGLRMSGGGAPFELRGRIVNTLPDVRVKSVTIEITRRDCYEGALDPSGCAVLWQERQWVEQSVPPLESRDFAMAIWARGAARGARGVVKDEFEVVAATGGPVR